MSFETTPRIMVLPAALLAGVGSIRDAYGEDLPDGIRTVKTLLGHRDREGSDALRAGLFGSTVAPIPLTDGRVAVIGYWTDGVIAKWQTDMGAGTGPLKDVVEFTFDQLEANRLVIQD